MSYRYRTVRYQYLKKKNIPTVLWTLDIFFIQEKLNPMVTTGISTMKQNQSSTQLWLTLLVLLISMKNVVASSGESNHNDGHSSPELAIGLFTAGIIGVTLIPILVPFHKHISLKLIAYIRCFSGGIFLSMGLYHMLQHAITDLRSFDFGNYNDGFPLIIAMLGYFIIFFIERVAVDDAHHSLHSDDSSTAGEVEEEEKDGSTTKDVEGQFNENDTPPSSSTVYVILVALSVHAVFEGIALGIQNDIRSVISLAVGILAHKWAESLTLSVSIQKHKQRNITLFLFTIMTPAGVGIGFIIQESSSSIVTAITQALSAGTFIYIACNERFVSEFHHCTRAERCLKFFFVLLGAGLIVGVGSFHSH